MKNSRTEPGRRWPQTDCRLEPPLRRLDNITFASGRDDILMHRSSPLCAFDVPHYMNECGLWLRLEEESAERRALGLI
jgi:hypothetical protein